MRRREFIAGFGGAAAWPLTSPAQHLSEVPIIGVLLALREDAEGKARFQVFRQELENRGWTEGRNVRIEHRWAGSDPDLARVYAAELLALKPTVILPPQPQVRRPFNAKRAAYQ